MKIYITKNLKHILLVSLMAMLSSVSAAMLPYITAEFIEHIEGLDAGNIGKYAGGFVLSVVGILIFEYFSKVFSAALMKRIMFQLKRDVVKKTLCMPANEYYKNDTNYYISIITEDIRNLYGDYFECIFDFVLSIIRIVVYSAFMFYLNTILAVVVLMCSVFSIFIPKLVGKKLSDLREKQAEENSRYIGVVKEIFGAFSLVNKHTRNAISNRHEEAGKKREGITFTYNKYRSFVEIFAGLSLYIINIATFVVGIIMIAKEMLTVGDFVAIISFIDLVAIPIRDMIYQFIGIKSANGLKDKLVNILKIDADEDKESIDSCNSIDIKNLNYNIEDFSLKGINLHFEKGKKYAIVGKSGAGKSTLFKLLLGQITDYSGNILIDGKNIRNYQVSDVFADIGQRPVMFDASAEDNITLFGSYNSKNLKDYIHGLDAEYLMRENCGEEGSNLSGGERNKIALLRALNRECEVLLCDEMFSALDRKNREDIADYIFSQKNRTVISITHDVSKAALSKYDEIIIIDAGKIVKSGLTKEMIAEVDGYFSGK